MYCFLQITRKVVRRVVIPHERKVGEMVMEWGLPGNNSKRRGLW